MHEKIILWDVDKTTIDPFHEARLQALHCWETHIRGLYPQISELQETELDLKMQGALYKKNTVAEAAGVIKPVVQVFKDLLAARGVIGASLDEAKIIGIMNAYPVPEQKFYDGILPLLEKLQKNGMRCGIVTKRNSEMLRPDHPLRQYMDSQLVFTEEDGDKGEPEGRASLIGKIKAVAPETEILVIGDQPGDAWLAADLGAHYIQPLYGNDQGYIDKIKPQIDDAAAIIESKGSSVSAVETAGQLAQAIETLGYMPRGPKKVPMTRTKTATA